MHGTATEQLRRYIQKHRTTQRALAAELGISETHLSAILAGRYGPSLDLAARVENLTGIPARAFASE